MIVEIMLCMEVVGCPTISRRCWAHGPYPAIPVADIADIADVLEQASAAGTAASQGEIPLGSSPIA